MKQLILTVFMFLVSRKFHSTWGIPGTEVTGTAMEQRYEQGRGWEWYDKQTILKKSPDSAPKGN